MVYNITMSNVVELRYIQKKLLKVYKRRSQQTKNKDEEAITSVFMK